MSKINNLLSSRFKSASEKLSKMTELATIASDGGLSSFAGIFRVAPLSSEEKEKIYALLSSFQNEGQEIAGDAALLADITSEVKAINNQAAILHGERIKKAQELLKKYRDGAFSAWLVAAYGNRQTPYNFLQYFELHRQLSKPLLQKLDAMPRQAVYTLASRGIALSEKEEIIKNYKGESKAELLDRIRKTFPLPSTDKRAEDPPEQAIFFLKRALRLFQERSLKPTSRQKAALQSLLSEIQQYVR